MRKISLNEAVQVGPWRVARKHLLFVILFGLVIIAFGLIILQTHVFDKEEEEDEEGEEEGDEEWGDFKGRFSSGDWIMVAIMVAAGLLSLVAVFACLVVKKNTPRRLSATPRRASVYSIQFNSDAAKAPLPQQSFGAPQQLPIWSGELIQPQQTQDHLQTNLHTQAIPPPVLTLPHILQQQPIEEVTIIQNQHARQNSSPHSSPQRSTHSSSRGAEGHSNENSGASTPRVEGNHPPPPYSP